MKNPDCFWRAVGGRKGFHGYLAYLTLSVMAFPLHASFGEYAMGMLAALGITSGAIAYEDSRAAKTTFPARRSSDPAPRTEDAPLPPPEA